MRRTPGATPGDRTEDTVIEGRGAVVRERGGPVTVEPVLVDDPGAGEVRVAVTANGVCHSDVWAIEHGNWGAPFPMLLGHEGAGLVESVGPGVDGLTPGTPVLLAWAVPCGACRACARGRPQRCDHAWEQPPRMRTTAGEPLIGTLAIGSLATHVVVRAPQAIAMPAGADDVSACLLGCGASTGVGAVLNTGEASAGDAVAVIGLGGIGLSAVQAARIAGAGPIVAVDLVASKLEVASRLGASHVVNASSDDAVAAVRDLTGGVDIAVEATGVADVVASAVAMLARAGTAVAVGVPRPRSTLTLPWGEGANGAAYPNKARLVITDGGDPVADDFTRWLGWTLDGRLDLRSMVTAEAPLGDREVAEAFRAMLAGEVVRTVIRPDGADASPAA
jgi:S-(hydroxymethyl)mycothiol dehydrogenase